jgi:PleD family two-component response regulator
MLVLLPNFRETEAGVVGECIRQTIEGTGYAPIGKRFVTATLGVATFPS